MRAGRLGFEVPSLRGKSMRVWKELANGGCTNVLGPSRRALRALLRMRYLLDGIKKNLILRKPRSGCLEGRADEVDAADVRSPRPFSVDSLLFRCYSAENSKSSAVALRYAVSRSERIRGLRQPAGCFFTANNSENSGGAWGAAARYGY